MSELDFETVPECRDGDGGPMPSSVGSADPADPDGGRADAMDGGTYEPVRPEIRDEQSQFMSTWGDQCEASPETAKSHVGEVNDSIPLAPAIEEALESVGTASARPLADTMEAAEYEVLKAQIEARLRKSLGRGRDAELRALVRQRVAALRQYGQLQRQKATIQKARAKAQQEAFIAHRKSQGMDYENLDELETVPDTKKGTYLHPYGWKSSLKQSFVENPKNLGRDMWHGFKHMVERSGELREEAFERGDYVGGQYGVVPFVLGESAVNGWQAGIDRASSGVEGLLEAESAVDAGLATLQVVLGIGEALLSADSLASPVAGARDMLGSGPVPRGGGGAMAAAEVGGRSRSMAGGAAGDLAVSVPAVATGPAGGLSHVAIISTFENDSSPKASGDKVAADEVRHAEPDAHAVEQTPQVEPKGGTKAKAANTTRKGVTRSNRADWNKLVKSWDEAGYGGALSPANRDLIAKGKVPLVDDAWIEHFPGDEALRGEKISMHHIGGSRLTVPHPKTRHKDAHMPGGFRKNPGGPGMTGAIEPEPEPDERRQA